MFKKEVIFNDQWSKTNEITEKSLTNLIQYTLEKANNFNVKLKSRKIINNSVVFNWSGTKFNLIRFYLHFYKRTDSLEKKLKTICKILNK